MLRAALLAIVLAGIATFDFGDDTNRAHPIAPGESGIGRPAPDLLVKGLDGRSGNLRTLGHGKPIVIALTSVTCPLAKKLGPTLAQLERTYGSKATFVYVNPAGDETTAQAKGDAARLGLKGIYVKDSDVAEALGAKTTTEAFVVDAQGRIVYRGAVDDQYGIGYSSERPKHRYLADAIESVLGGKAPAVAATWAPGCLLEPAQAEVKAVTYSERVAEIVQDRCVTCHRDGGVAPFKLDSYASVKSRAPMIKYVVEKGIMPPWFASKAAGQGPWKNDRSLTEAERADLFSWIENGTPEGDPKKTPPMKPFDPKWAIGHPDAVVKLPEPIKVNATGIMPYQNVIVPTNFTDDRWIQSMEVRPSARQVVHHVLIFIREKGQTRGEVGEEISGFFAAYVPGTSTVFYPDGFGKKVPAGASLKFQIHYTPNGTEAFDQTELGMVFAKKPVEHEVQTVGIANLFINIPPGADNHKETAQIPVPANVRILSLIPHMHVRGKAARYDLVQPDGTRETLLDVPRYDFNWQLAYEYKDPKPIEKGSKVEFSAWYDNSDKNPANPDPNKRVRWGSQTYDEMHLGYVEYYVPGLKAGQPLPRLRPGFGTGGALVETLFKQMDKDADGFVTEAEAGASWRRLQVADKNGDGKISLDEAKAQFGG